MEADNGNGRVTLALLGAKIDMVLARLDQMERKMDGFEHRLHCDELEAKGRETRLKQAEEEIDSLQKRSTTGDIIAGMLAAVAGVIGWFK